MVNPSGAAETMKGPVLSAWLAAGLVLVASGARAEPADCDMFCHLQGYLSTDHMEAAPGGSAPPSGASAKPRHHATSVPTKATQPIVKTSSKPAPTAGEAKKPVEAVAGADRHRGSSKNTSTASAVARATPEPSADRKAAEALPKPTAPADASTKPSKHRTIAAAEPPPAAEAAPARSAPPTRSRRLARLLPRVDRKDPKIPVASAADLIPGGAQLVPAEFQTFGNL